MIWRRCDRRGGSFWTACGRVLALLAWRNDMCDFEAVVSHRVVDGEGVGLDVAFEIK